MEKYATITDLMTKTLRDAIAKKFFKISDFFRDMENEFARWGFRDKDFGGVDNILLVRLDAVGDFVLTSAAIREIRMNYPYARITLVVSDRAYSLAEFCPYVNEVLPFKMNFNISNMAEIVNNVGAFAKKYLWNRQFNLAFSFRYFKDWYFVQIFMVYLSGAKIRVGYDQQAGYIYTGTRFTVDVDIGRKILTHPISANVDITGDCKRSLYILKTFGLHINHDNLEVWYTASNVFDSKYYLKNFAPGRIKILVGIGASHPIKDYPVNKYLEAFKQIIDKNAAIIIAGGAGDREKSEFLKNNLPSDCVKSLIDIKSSWRMTAAVASLCDMYIGNDTGTVHIASALHLPVIVLSRVAKNHKRPNEIETYHPYKTPAVVLQPANQMGDCINHLDYYGGCSADDSHCITQIDPDEIVAAYDKILAVMKFFNKSEGVQI